MLADVAAIVRRILVCVVRSWENGGECFVWCNQAFSRFSIPRWQFAGEDVHHLWGICTRWLLRTPLEGSVVHFVRVTTAT